MSFRHRAKEIYELANSTQIYFQAFCLQKKLLRNPKIPKLPPPIMHSDLVRKNYHIMLSFFLFLFTIMVTPYGVKKYVLHIMCKTDQTTQFYLKYMYIFKSYFVQ